MDDCHAVTDIRPVTAAQKIPVSMADGKQIWPYAAGYVTFRTGDRLPVLLFQELAGSLISVGQIVDAFEARATFDSTSMAITKKNNNDIIITGIRCPKTKMWLINWQDLQANPRPSPAQANNAAHAVPVHTMEELVRFWHQSIWAAPHPPHCSVLSNQVVSSSLNSPTPPSINTGR